jgi:tetratricopeptide (TPR) repeat protein
MFQVAACALLLTTCLGAQQKFAAESRSIAAQLDRAGQLADSGKFDAARAEYERAIRNGGKSQVEANAQHARRLGLCYLNTQPQNLTEASHYLELAHRAQPADYDTALYYAQSLAWTGKHDESAKIYGELHAVFPGNADYVIGLANSLFGKGDADGALSVLERFTQDAPSNLSVRLIFARFLGYSKRYVQALSQYQAVLQIDPANIEAKIGIAKVNSWQGNNDLALEMFDKVLRTHPRSYDALVGKAYSLLWMGRKTEARQIFATLNERNPADKEIAATLKSLPAPTPPVLAVKGGDAKLPLEPEFPESQPDVNSISTGSAPAPEIAMPAFDKKSELLLLAQQSTNAGNFVEAIHRYHELLQLDPGNASARLQIARLLSWSRSYDDSIAAYDEILRNDPHQVKVQAERARVLSWAKRFPESLSGYDAAIRDASTCSGADCPSARSLRIEYARVLSWAGRYDEALAEYEKLQIPDPPATEEDRTAALDRGKTLAWAKRYSEASGQFDKVIAAGGDTFDARLGKAQVTYWSGSVRASAVQLRRLAIERPKDATVALTLAAVEHNLGYNSRALSLLSIAEPGVEADSLRETIRGDIRPILRFRYGYEDDLESESNGAESTIKVLRYTSSVDFNVHPDVRMQVLNTVTHGLTSNTLLGKHSGDTVATETLARLRFQVKPWMTLNLGGGVGTSGGYSLGASAPRRQQALFEVRPTIVVRNLRLDLGVTRRLAEYTPLAIADNAVHTRLTSVVSYQWKRLRGTAEYWHGLYTVDSPEPGRPREFSTEGNGGSLFISGTAIKRERFTADLGMRYEAFGYDQGGFHIADPINGIGSGGFFTPRLYQRYSGNVNFGWAPAKPVRFNLGGSFGPQRVFGYPELSPPPGQWGTTGSLDFSSTYSWKKVVLTGGYSFFSTATASFPGLNNGTYESHSAVFELAYKF